MRPTIDDIESGHGKRNFSIPGEISYVAIKWYVVCSGSGSAYSQ